MLGRVMMPSGTASCTSCNTRFIISPSPSGFVQHSLHHLPEPEGQAKRSNPAANEYKDLQSEITRLRSATKQITDIFSGLKTPFGGICNPAASEYKDLQSEISAL